MPAERVDLPIRRRHRCVHLMELREGEFLIADQAFGVRCGGIEPMHLLHRIVHDRVLPVRQSTLTCDADGTVHDGRQLEIRRRREGRGEARERQGQQVGHGHDPAAVIALGVVEEVQLPWAASVEVCGGEAALLLQGHRDGLGKTLAFADESAGQSPRAVLVSMPAHQEQTHLACGINGQDALVDRLDEAEGDLTGLKDSVVSHDAMFSMKLMTDSLAMSSRGRKPKTGKKRSPKASGSNGRPSEHSGGVDDSDEVASA